MTLPEHGIPWPPWIADHCRLALCSSEEIRDRFTDTPEQYLTPHEKKTWEEIKNSEYRRDWFAGRMLVKELFDSLEADSVSAFSKHKRFRRYEIISRNVSRQSIRPRLIIDGIDSGRTISISHAGKMICAGIGLSPEARFGLDITPLEAVTSAVVRSFFSKHEKKMMIATPGRSFAEQLWCVKEATYKALCETEPFMPRLFQSTSQGEGFFICSYRYRNEEKQAHVFTGCCESVVYAIAMASDAVLPETAPDMSSVLFFHPTASRTTL